MKPKGLASDQLEQRNYSTGFKQQGSSIIIGARERVIGKSSGYHLLCNLLTTRFRHAKLVTEILDN
jgi:hypothetical protein